MDDQNPAGVGHNSPPPYDPEVFDKLASRVRELSEAGKAWGELKNLDNEEQAGKLADFLTQARATSKAVTETRREQKKPHEDAGKAVDTKFNPLKTIVDDLGKKLKSTLLDPFTIEKNRREEEEKRRKAEEARKAAEEADRLKREAEEKDDEIAKAEAEAAEKAAEKAAKSAAKPVRTNVASGTGGGRTVSLRTYYRAEVERRNGAFSWFRDHPEYGPKLDALMIQMAEAEHRKKDGVKEIPGIKFIEEKRIA